jgi:hypothetical protein
MHDIDRDYLFYDTHDDGRVRVTESEDVCADVTRDRIRTGLEPHGQLAGGNEKGCPD